MTYDMKLIPDNIGELDLVVLPMGDNFTMSIDTAIKASTFLGCNKVLGYHYDTFGYIKINHREAPGGNFFLVIRVSLSVLKIDHFLIESGA